MKYIIKKDGNSWCCYDETFINLQESDAEFGDTPQEALNNFIKKFREQGGIR